MWGSNPKFPIVQLGKLRGLSTTLKVLTLFECISISPKGKDLEEEKKKKRKKKTHKKPRSVFMNQTAKRVFRGWKRWAMRRGTESRVR